MKPQISLYNYYCLLYLFLFISLLFILFIIYSPFAYKLDYNFILWTHP